ncbi:AAA family ATPase [Rhodococcus hoagii]|nr:AAA family ATPase [Prescottella equi]
MCKPAQTGVTVDEPGDLAEVTRLSGVTATVELARYPEPLAPDTAARRAALPMLTQPEVVAATRDLDARHDVTLVEGAGGLLVRLGVDGFTVRDVAAELGAPVVVVAAGRSGHPQSLRAHGRSACRCGREVQRVRRRILASASGSRGRCNLHDLPAVTGSAVVGRVPRASRARTPPDSPRPRPTWFEPDWLDSLLIRR